MRAGFSIGVRANTPAGTSVASTVTIFFSCYYWISIRAKGEDKQLRAFDILHQRTELDG
jgi:hypothetical protein